MMAKSTKPVGQPNTPPAATHSATKPINAMIAEAALVSGSGILFSFGCNFTELPAFVLGRAVKIGTMHKEHGFVEAPNRTAAGALRQGDANQSAGFGVEGARGLVSGPGHNVASSASSGCQSAHVYRLQSRDMRDSSAIRMLRRLRF